MKRIFIFSMVLVVSLLTLTPGAVALDLTSGEYQQTEENATANESETITPTATATPSSSPTPTPTETATAEPTPEPEQDDGPSVEVDADVSADNTTYAQQIDPNLRLVEWEYSDGAFKLIFEADRAKSVTITEAVQFEAGAGSGRIYNQRLPDGTTEISVPVEKRGGQAAVTMVTSASLERNTYSYVSTGQTDPDRPAITYSRAQALILISGVGAAGLTFRIVRKRRDDEDKQVEKIL